MHISLFKGRLNNFLNGGVVMKCMGIISVLIVICLSGCSMYLPPTTGGRSGYNQLLESETLEETLDRISVPGALKGKHVNLEVYSIDDCGKSTFVKGSLKRIIAENNCGLRYVDSPAEAGVNVLCIVDTLGVDNYSQERGNIFQEFIKMPVNIFYNVDYNCKAICKMRLLIMDEDNRVLKQENSYATNSLRQYRLLFSLIGPFRSSTLKRLEHF